MADARPLQFARPDGWYAKTTEPHPGLTPARIIQPQNPSAKVSKRCECGEKCWLLDGKTETICSCGAVVK